MHFHLLPGVDDGPATVQESVALARMAIADGTATVVATPHARLVDVRAVPDHVRALRARLTVDRVPLRVLPGLEIAQDDVARLTDGELEIVAQGPPGRRWLLLEAPVSADPSPFPDAARELMARGYGVLIGHPERCRGLMTASGMLDELLVAGARLQLNGSSLIGRHGDDARSWALELALARIHRLLGWVTQDRAPRGRAGGDLVCFCGVIGRRRVDGVCAGACWGVGGLR